MPDHQAVRLQFCLSAPPWLQILCPLASPKQAAHMIEADGNKAAGAESKTLRPTTLILINLGPAPGSACLPKHTLSCSSFLRQREANSGAAMSCGQPARWLGTSCGQRCERALGLQETGEGGLEMPAAKMQCSPVWKMITFIVEEKPGLKCEIKGNAEFGKDF